MNRLHPILLYSTFGSGKTSLIGQLVEELLKDLPAGSKARLTTCEHYSSVQHLIDAGLIEVWKINTRPHPFETVRAAVDGYWPQDTNDPTSPLIAPTADTWKQYPIRIHEGLATYANYISSNHFEGGLLDRAGRGDVLGPVQEHVQFTDGEASIGGLCWTHYRIGQLEMTGLVQRSQKHPGYVIWTSHEDDGKEKGQPIVGPEVFGNKLTGVIGREFADVFRIGQIAHDYDDGNGGRRRITERRLYVKDHFDGSLPIVHKAKNSAGLDRQKDVPDYFRLTNNDEDYAKDKTLIPGLPRPGIAEKIVDTLWRRK